MLGKYARAVAFVGIVAVVGGCTAAENFSIFRTVKLDKGKSVITDAKQRIVTNVPARGEDGFNKPERIVCAEPSPDVAQALSDSISAALKVDIAGKGGGSAGFGRSSAEAVAQLGERLGTIQLLRDGLYRACEAYANGAITRTTYSMIVSRIDNTMVTLLMGELAAGAFGRSGALISAAASGAAQAGGGAASETAIKDFQEKQEKLDKAETNLATKEKEYEDLKVQQEPKPNDDQLKNAKMNAEGATKERDDAKEKRDLAVKVLAGSVGAATSARGLGGNAMGAIENAKETSKVAGAVLQAMHKAYLDDDAHDYTPLVKACVTALDRAEGSGKLTRSDLEFLGGLAADASEAEREYIEAEQASKKDSGNKGAIAAMESAKSKNKMAEEAFQAAAKEFKGKLSFKGLTELGIVCESLIMPKVAAILSMAPELAKASIARDQAVAQADEAKAKQAKAVTTVKLSDDVEKSAKAAQESAQKAESAAAGSALSAKMLLCVESLSKAADQAGALNILKACFEKVP